MPGGEKLDLLAELRSRGFARGDTERMRLVLEALPHLTAPSRRTRRLIHRPYFDEARAVFEIVAPTCGGDPDVLASFLSDPDAWLESRSGEHRRVEPRDSAAGPSGPGSGRRRRRGRRGGRSRYRRRSGAAADGLASASHNGESQAHGEGETTGETRHTEPAGSAVAPRPLGLFGEAAAAPAAGVDPAQRPRG